MRNQLEDRVEALENAVLDMIELIAQGTVQTVSIPDVVTLAAAVREAGEKLRSIYTSSYPQQVGTPVKMQEAIQRLTAVSNTILDRRSGIT